MQKILEYLLSLCSLPVLGMVLTANYLLLVYWRFHDRFFQLEEMPLNEVGDFLAGVFGPIAFGWLIIGYLMQNKELKSSVEQTAEAHKLARDQLTFQKEIEDEKRRAKHNKSQPIFKVIKKDLHEDGSKIKIEIKNTGSAISSFLMLASEYAEEYGANYSVPIFNGDWGRGEEKGIEIDLRKISPSKDSEPRIMVYQFQVEFIDGDENLRETIFKVWVIQNGRFNAYFETTRYIKDPRSDHGNRSD